MAEVKIVFKNYKKLVDGEYNLSNSSIFFIQGPNEIGKTSFVHLLQSIMEVKDETVNPVTFGEKEGFAVGTITGADGLPYQFRYDFNIDGQKKFTFIGPDNKKLKSVGEMRSIFNYTHFTVDEFFNWSHDAKGRAKQKEIIMQLLTDGEKAKILSIDGKINTSSGELFLKRQNINRDIDYLKTVVEKGNSFTEEEKKLLAQKSDIVAGVAKLKSLKEEADTFIANSSSAATIVQMAQTAYDNCVEKYEQTIKDKADEVQRINTEIEEYEKKIAELKIKRDTAANTAELNKTFNEESKELLSQLNKAKEGIDEKKLQYYKSLNEDTEVEGKESKAISTRISMGETLERQIINLEARKEQYDKSVADYNAKKVEADTLTEQIETLRNEKANIIKNSTAIPAGIQIGDDYITVDDIPFVETDLCKSAAIETVAKLMMIINKAPIMLMGDAENLGYPVLDRLSEEAKKNGKIMIFAEHVRDSEELSLVCYDELDKPKSKAAKKDSIADGLFETE